MRLSVLREGPRGDRTCEGGEMTPDDLTRIVLADKNAEIARLTRQRDALLAACEEALECLRFDVEENGSTKDKLIAAIALVKGEK